MNKSQLDAIKNAIGGMEDNLYRAKLQKKAMPDWHSGNGEHIDELIAQYEKGIAELKEPL